jgi:hypothetical protein
MLRAGMLLITARRRYTSKADQALLAFTETIREINSQRTELLLR